MSTHARPRKCPKLRRVGNDGLLGALVGRERNALITPEAPVRVDRERRLEELIGWTRDPLGEQREGSG